MRAADRFQPSVAQLTSGRSAGRARLASPANPTGTMVAPAELAALAELVRRHGTRLVSDEIYHDITYDQPAVRLAGSQPRSWSAVLEVLLDDRLADRLAAGAGRPARLRSTGWPAISPSARPRCRSSPRSPRSTPTTSSTRTSPLPGQPRPAARRLPEIGLDKIAPADGAFYIYADVSRWTDDSLNWALAAAAGGRVAVAPGIDFDPLDGGKFIRLCFAGDGADIDRAVDRLGEWLQRQPTL